MVMVAGMFMCVWVGDAYLGQLKNSSTVDHQLMLTKKTSNFTPFVEILRGNTYL